MNCARTLVGWFLLAGLVFADEPKSYLVRFKVDPPNFEVGWKGTRVGGLAHDPQTLAQEIPLAPASDGYYVFPPEAVKSGRCTLVFRAPGYNKLERELVGEVNPGPNDWPRDGSLVALQPVSLTAVIGQFFRLHGLLAGVVALLLGGTSLAGLLMLLSRLRRRRFQQRLLSLGGEEDARPIGPFWPIGVLGQGGFGVVVKGVHSDQFYKKDPEIVAVKTLLHVNLDEEVKEGSEAESRRARFRREAQALERLDHPNIVRLVHYSLEGSTPYLAMEYVDGQSFQSLIRKHPNGMPPKKALELILPVCEAMLYAHTRSPQMIHRDIKPENIMLGRNGQVKVMDLGLAHSLGEKRITRTHEWMGTPHYASPEYLTGVVSPAVDQFAIGLVLFELLVGRSANPSDTAEGAIHAVLLGQLPTLSSIHPEWGEFARTVDRMSHLEHVKRFPSLAEAIQALKDNCPKAQ